MKGTISPERLARCRRHLDALGVRLFTQLQGELGVEPVVVVKARRELCAAWAGVLRGAEGFRDRPVTVHRVTSVAAEWAPPGREPWLALIHTKSLRDPRWYWRVADQFPRMQILALADDETSVERVPIGQCVEWLSVGRENWSPDIQAVAGSVPLRRRALAAQMVYAQLASYAVRSWGADVAAALGFVVERGRSLRELRIELLERALKEQGSVDGAASVLGVDRSTVYRWRQRYGI